jgi:hypothetical protein
VTRWDQYHPLPFPALPAEAPETEPGIGAWLWLIDPFIAKTLNMDESAV